MGSKNNTKSLVKKQKREVEIHTPKTTLSTPDENILGKIKREDEQGNGQFIAFDFVRLGLGDRDIYSKKVFFETMVTLSILEKTGIDYSPTNEALAKYPIWFVRDDQTKKWGMRPSIREDFVEEFIYPVYTPMAARILSIMKKSKKELQNARAREKRRVDKIQKELESLKVGV